MSCLIYLLFTEIILCFLGLQPNLGFDGQVLYSTVWVKSIKITFSFKRQTEKDTPLNNEIPRLKKKKKKKYLNYQTIPEAQQTHNTHNITK